MEIGVRGSPLWLLVLLPLACTALADPNAMPPARNGQGDGTGGAFELGGGGGEPSLAGSADSGNGGTGGEGSSGCLDRRIVELFDFTDGSVVVNITATTTNDHWIKCGHDSTDISTGQTDTTANPSYNPTNLAYLSKLDVDTDKGDEKPAMRYTIPFSRSPSSVETARLVYIFASTQESFNTVDLSNAVLKSSAMLTQGPTGPCVVSAQAWSTSTDATGSEFAHVDGPKVYLNRGQWTTIELDLATNTHPAAVNQYGFAFTTTCAKYTPIEGGASSGDDADPTIVLIDNIQTRCE